MGSYQLVVLMAGKSNRFLEAGYRKPKALLEANGKLILNRIIDSFESADQVLVIASEKQKQFLSDINLGYGSLKNIVVCYIEEHDLGPSESLIRAQNLLSDSQPITVTYCDFAVVIDDQVLVSELEKNVATCVVISGFHPHTIRKPKFGYINADSENSIIEVREKTSFSDNPLAEKASTGVYGFRSKEALLEGLTLQKEKKAQVNGEYYVSLAVDQLVQAGKKASIMCVNRFACWGTPEDLEDFNHYSKIQEIINGNDTGGRVLGSTKLYLAGGQGERSRHLTGKYKALLNLNEDLCTQLWTRSGGRESRAANELSYFVSYPQVLSEIKLPEDYCGQLISIPLDKQTEDACETVQVALRAIGNIVGPISVIASDNLMGFSSDSDLQQIEYDLLVWLAISYPIAELSPEQYSWALVSDTDRIGGVSIKEKPADGNHWYTIVGNFTFKDTETAVNLISEVKSKAREPKEQHLESVIKVAIDKGLNVKSLFVENYMSVGVPEEIQLFNYLQSGIYAEI